MSEQLFDDDIEHLFKLVLIGDSEVGKSNILRRFTKNTFSLDSKATIGVEFSAKKMVIDGVAVKVQLWDTAGQEKFRAITKAYYRGAVGAMLIYDITNKRSFESMTRWLSEIKEWADTQNIIVMMLGNKADIDEKRDVSKEEAIQFAENNKIGFLETSALSGQNIEFAFKKLVEEILRSSVKKRKQSEQQFKSELISEKDLSTQRLSTQQPYKGQNKGCC